MMPSRGARLLRSQLPRSLKPQNRNLSSTSRIPWNPRNTPTAISTSRATLQWRTIPSVTLCAAYTARHASTAPATSEPILPGAAASPPNSTPPIALDPSIDTITLDKFDQATEGVGYLHELGIDYGWGPTSMIQWVLENAHFTLGLPWWAAIAVTGVGLRIAMAPLFVKSADAMARQSAMVPITKPITDEMWQLRKDGKNQEAMIAMQKVNLIKKQAGISTKDIYIPMLMQAVVGFCGFKLMRAMALLPVPGLDTGGFLWLTDLTATDPFLIIPVVMGLAMHGVMRLGGESGSQNFDVYSQKMRNMMMYGMPAIIVLATVWQPGALCVWFMSTGVVGLTQGVLLQRPSVRNALGIAPNYKPAPGESSSVDQLAAMFGGKRFGKNDVKTNIAPEPKDDAQSMHPQYQAPRVIDAKLVRKSVPNASTQGLGRSPASPPPQASSDGVLGHLKARYKQAKEQQTKWTQETAEKKQHEAKKLREKKGHEEREKRIQQMRKKR